MNFPLAAWWVRSPLLRILIAFTCGIGWAILHPGRYPFFVNGFILFVLAFSGALILPRRWNRARQWPGGLLLFCLFLFAGALHTSFREKQLMSLGLIEDRKHCCLITVLTAPTQTKSGIRFEASLSMKTSAGLWRKFPGRTIVYLGNSSVGRYQPGTRWAVFGGPSPIPRTRNPGAPDFNAYFQARGIQYQYFLEPEAMIPIPAKSVFNPSQAMENQRTWVLQLLSQNFRDTKILGLAEAILLGYKAHLDPEVGSAFVKTGVMHVIAISGMHLSLIFSLLMALFRFVPAGRPRLLASLLAPIPAIWWFSLLTGGSASAIRSAIMCTLPVTALIFSRKILSLNNLSASALLMLFYQPLWVKDLGFQLSFAALLGIIVWQPAINQWFRFHNPVLKNCWNLISVTIAAQVFTTPLVIFYFHQFPLLFLFANICAVPLSSLALVLEILLCVFSFSDQLSGILAPLCEWILRILLVSVDSFSRIPGSVLQHLYLAPLQVLLIILDILLFKAWLLSRQPPILFLVMVSFLLFMTTVLYEENSIRQQRWFAVLHQRNTSIVALVRGRSARIYLAYGNNSHPSQVKTVIRQFLQYYRIRQVSLVQLPASENAILQAGQWEVIIARNIHPPLIAATPNAFRILVFCRDAGGQLQAWQERIRPSIVVIDGTHALWKIQRWEKEAEKLPLRLHLTPKDGAFLLNCHNSLTHAKKN